MLKLTDHLGHTLNALACSILVLVNAGFLLAECPKQIWCKTTVLSCTAGPNSNGVCPGKNEKNYKDNFGGSDTDTHTCEESDVFANCTWTCPCMVIPGNYGLPPTCGPDDDSDDCQLSKSVTKYAKEKGA